MIGQIVKAHSNRFEVLSGGETFVCSLRGKMKLKSDFALVGDYVEFADGVILKISERKNRFVRPAVANVDVVVIVAAAEPAPDFLLIDKMLVNAGKEGVEAVFAVNKADIGRLPYEAIRRDYGSLGADILEVSAKTGSGMEDLRKRLDGKLAVFAGQSAVGKTSLINRLCGLSLRVGDLSEKTCRGRHTTTYSSIYQAGNCRVADTPGFAVLEADLSADEIKDYYEDFIEYAADCRFRGCTHTAEPGCAVKKKVEEKIVSEGRYERYCRIFAEQKEKRHEY